MLRGADVLRDAGRGVGTLRCGFPDGNDQRLTKRAWTLGHSSDAPRTRLCIGRPRNRCFLRSNRRSRYSRTLRREDSRQFRPHGTGHLYRCSRRPGRSFPDSIPYLIGSVPASVRSASSCACRVSLLPRKSGFRPVRPSQLPDPRRHGVGRSFVAVAGSGHQTAGRPCASLYRWRECRLAAAVGAWTHRTIVRVGAHLPIDWLLARKGI
jgi:hypothetical protein